MEDDNPRKRRATRNRHAGREPPGQAFKDFRSVGPPRRTHGREPFSRDASARGWNSGCKSELAMRVAFATQDLSTVDAHFGCARHISVWEVTADGARELERLSFDEAEEDGDHDKLAPRIEAVRGCSVVFVAAIGPAAAGLAVASGVLPVRIAEGEPIAEAARKLGRVLGGTPPPWLRKALRREGEGREEPEGDRE